MKTEQIFTTIATGELADLERLLEQEPRLADARNGEGISAALFSLYNRKPEMAQALLAREPELDVMDAAALGRVQRLAELLPAALEHQATDGFRPLHIACFFGQPASARALIEAGADVNAVSTNPMELRPLHSAVACSSLPISTMLLEAGAEVNAAQHGGWTALHSAAMHGSVELITVLLKHGASHGVAADNGKTATDLAREAGHGAVLELLAGETS